jgi:carbamoyltransferase
MTYILGVSAGFHDAAVSVISDRGDIVFAAHSERYSKLKNDPGISPDLVKEIVKFDLSCVAWYERPWMHNLQQWVSGQHQYGPWTAKSVVQQHLGHDFVLNDTQIKSHRHHLSHAAAGFQTSPFESAAVVVIDAIGELDTISIYRAWYDDQGRAQYKRLWCQGYPHSIGLFYSAITERVGLRPMDEEYITMGMSAYGNPLNSFYLASRYLEDLKEIRFRENLHIGIAKNELAWMTDQDLAACAQALTESLIANVMSHARSITGEENLVYMGGVALNCLANRHLGQYFSRIWIMPNPGDAGSSLGAAALSYGGKLNWKDPYLGHEIEGEYPITLLLQELLDQKIAAVASGPAEFGPRALGNRSLLADPRGADIKDRVNDIKRRQQFRPFAPAILAEHVNDYFDMPRSWSDSDYMQVVASCRRPDLYPAVCHVDGTSRVQTVPGNSGSGLRRLLEQWYDQTGCPMLLNTSLNIRGEPMVNDRVDARRFEKIYGVRVFS